MTTIVISDSDHSDVEQWKVGRDESDFERMKVGSDGDDACRAVIALYTSVWLPACGTYTPAIKSFLPDLYAHVRR